MNDLNNIADARPIMTGVIGTVLGWGGAIAAWLEIAHKVVLVLGGVFGTVGAFFAMLIVIRNYRKGKDNKQENG